MIRLDGVRFGYRRGETTLSADELEIGEGLTLLVGPNGSGKSTLLRLAAGVERPREGRVRIDGRDLWDEEIAARRSLAYVPEFPDLTPYASLLDVMGLVCRLRGEPLARAGAALAEAGLSGLGGRSIRELSMGQRRRAMLAAAWIGAPTTILLDEPLETLDRPMRAKLVAWIAARLDGGALVLIATHEIEPFVGPCRRALSVVEGRPRLEELGGDPAAKLRRLEAMAAGTP